MTVGELIKALTGFPEDFPVIMSKDAEGNEFSPLSNISIGTYLPETPWSGEAYPTREVMREEMDDWFIDPDTEELLDVVFLDPVN